MHCVLVEKSWLQSTQCLWELLQTLFHSLWYMRSFSFGSPRGLFVDLLPCLFQNFLILRRAIGSQLPPANLLYLSHPSFSPKYCFLWAGSNDSEKQEKPPSLSSKFHLMPSVCWLKNYIEKANRINIDCHDGHLWVRKGEEWNKLLQEAMLASSWVTT